MRADALIAADTLLVSSRGFIVEFAGKHGLPTVFGIRDFVDTGDLMSYGVSIFDLQGANSRRAG
jgi:hypothetical protein